MRGHVGAVERLGADARIALSGRPAAREHRADIIMLDDTLTGYASAPHIGTIVDEYRLRPAPRSEANVLLRIAPHRTK